MTFLLPTSHSNAEDNKNPEQIYEERMFLYKKVEVITQIPWYYFAAIDQYERSLRRSRKDLPKAEGLTGIYFNPTFWAGSLNPNKEDTNQVSIGLFGGMGLDGNGDGKAESTNDEDVLFTLADYISGYGYDDENIKIALWDYYQRDKTVDIIMGKVKLYKAYDTLDLDKHAFPLPLRFNYSFKNTWGDARGWGGRRIHEGTDIFANYGTPVRSTCYGVVEIKGWNRYGGWRVGIRDINNTYHYFAHLNGFTEIKEGQIVEPGMVIGSVGSSGYGPPGTAGKFPPHLHYGMYKDNGYTEWSFDPFPHLKSWERAERRSKK
ncbi:M23 family metallopeptidase [Cytobacillus sp. S13-E01]|uniref:M23 family metallopeptidase n=1 Tax=Cytobacillus sp. S13-E01 TaxID=3031326 RepID=UPI0023D82483|nr:M23 family metallopeptidase [Cytobacillus sp. S13-E01]MDF0727443.1 M23 family metallopeptidase [Cytobacillus sp. S13-E01]